MIGIGNPDRGDDGIGPLVVRRLAGCLPHDVEIIERAGDALALIDDWAGRDVVILVDAAAGAAAGRVHRVDLLTETLPIEMSLSSTHAFGVAEAVGLARSLDLLPVRLIAYAIEAAAFAPGAPVGAAVAAAADEVVARVAAELRQPENAMTGDAGHA